jgi:hypothetical protein
MLASWLTGQPPSRPGDANVGLLTTAMIGPYVYNGLNWVAEGLLDLD